MVTCRSLQYFSLFPTRLTLNTSCDFVGRILYLFIYLGFYITFNTVQVISRLAVGRPQKTSTYSWSRFCTVNCQPTVSNYQLSHLRPCWEKNPGLRRGRGECYHSATVAPEQYLKYKCITYLYVT